MHPCGFDVISELASSMGVANAYHGHLHEFWTIPLARGGVLVFAAS
jgi:hypothetical protein